MLKLAYNDIDNFGPEEVEGLALGLGQCSALVTLDLERNRIMAQGARSLAGALWQCLSLAVLNLQDTEIGDEGARWLAGALGQNSSLTTLNLAGDPGREYGQDNLIGAEGARSLAGVLGQCSALATLDLTYNDEMGDEGIAMIQMSIPDTVQLVV